MSKIEVNTVDTQCGTNLTVGAACKSVTVAGNDVRSNAYKAADGGNIASQSGTTITLGASGDTVTLASGASQSGFGRTGTVNWDTTVKTSGFTGVSGNGYFTNTTSSAFTITLPASPSAGDIIAVADYANTWDTNNLTLGRNGSNIEGDASDFVCTEEGASITFVYVDSTKGWVTVNSGNSTQAFTETFMSASGGTITTSGNYKIHTFTGPGTFTVNCVSNISSNNIVSYVVVAGGGAGGGGVGGGGGAGGFREYKGPADCYTASPLNGNPGGTAVTVTAQGYPITVGGGGSPPGGSVTGPNGSNSVFSTITSAGGGGGARNSAAGSGGSGGGAYGGGGPTNNTIGNGNTPPVSPPQGFPGGTPGSCCSESGGGGGGAGAVGGVGTNNPPGVNDGGPGGAGVATQITGSPVTRAGGGGGSGFSGTGGAGGSGGGGDSGPGRSAGSGTAGSANTGGGGGAGNYAPGTPPAAIGGAGGSGIVIIRYKFQ